MEANGKFGHGGARRRAAVGGRPGHDLSVTLAIPAGAEPAAQSFFGGSFGILVVLFLGSRLCSFFLQRPGGFFGEWSDFNYFKEMAELSAQGYYPAVHYWVEYPPLFPWLLVGAYKLSLLLPAWRHPMLWFQLPISLVLILADLGSLFLIRRIGDRLWGDRRGTLGAWLYAGLFMPFYSTTVWFDALTVFCILFGVELLLQRRSALAGLICGLGIALKLYPILLLPVAVRALRGVGRWVLFTAAALVIPIATILPFLRGDSTMLVATFQGIANRRAWESVWALLDGDYDTGGIAALPDRLLYPASALWSNPSHLPWPAISAAFAVVLVVVWWFAGVAMADEGARVGSFRGLFQSVFGVKRLEMSPRRVVALTAFTITLFLLYNKGFSPQFTMLLLPFVVLLTPTFRGALFATALATNNSLLEGYVWGNVFPNDIRLLSTTVGIRTLLLVIFAFWTAGPLIPSVGGSWRRARPFVSAGLALLAVGLVLYGGVSLCREYWRDSLTNSPRSAAIQRVAATSPGTVVLFASEALHVAFQPFLNPRAGYVLADPKLLKRTGDVSLYSRLNEFTSGHAEAVFVVEASRRDEPLPAAARHWLARNGTLADSRVDNDTLTERYVLRPAATGAPLASFGGVLGLTGVDLGTEPLKPGGELRARVDWQALGPIGRDYTVFAHLVRVADGVETIVAQRDAQPVDNTYPMSGWNAGERVADEIVLTLPPTLPVGDYRLALGVYYVPTLQRLPSSGPGAANIKVESDRIVVGSVPIVTGR